MTTYMGWVVPNRTGEKAGGSSGVAVYKLTAMDRVHLERGELHKIPTAADRGLSYPELEERKGSLPTVAWNSGKVKEGAV